MMKNTLAWLFVTTLICILSGCARTQRQSNDIVLDDGIRFRLQSTPSSFINRGTQSLVKVERGGEVNQFIVQTEISDMGVIMAGLTTDGISLFNINWKPSTQELTIDKAIPVDLDLARVLVEFQLAQWPEKSVKAGLVGAKLSVDDSGNRKLSSANNELYYSIEKKKQNFVLTNKKLGYVLNIQELDRWTVEQ